MSIKWVGASSGNFTEGRQGKAVSKIILHWIVGTLESADATFQNPARDASAHYGIGDDEIHQYVKDEDTAWHAGNWNVNLESIGIEHEGGYMLNGKRVKPSEKTHQTSAQLVYDLCKKYGIPIDRSHILKHNEVSDTPTECCGTLDIDYIVSLAKAKDNPCAEVERELDEMRISRNEWKSKYKNLEDKYKTDIKAKNDHIELIDTALLDSRKDVEELQKRITALEKVVTSNKTPLSEYEVKELMSEILKRIRW